MTNFCLILMNYRIYVINKFVERRKGPTHSCLIKGEQYEQNHRYRLRYNK